MTKRRKPISKAKPAEAELAVRPPLWSLDNPWGRVLAALSVIILAFVVYVPAMDRGGWVWDDDDHLLKDDLIAAPDGWWRIWLDPQPGAEVEAGTAIVWNYWPMSRTSFWIEHKLWQYEPRGYHVTNVALHALNALMVLAVLRLLRVPGAWLAAALFAVHPVGVESAAWVTQRKTLLSTFFYLAALATYLRYERGKGARWYWITVVLFLLALLSKTATVMLPVVFVLLRWYFKRSWTLRDCLKLAPFFALSAIMGGVSIVYERFFIGSSGAEWTAGFIERLAGAGKIIWFYLSKALLPVGLSFNYPRWPIETSSIVTYLPVAGVFVVAGLLFWQRRRAWAAALILGLGYFLINLFPVLGFFNIYGMRYTYATDHWQYLSLVGVIALVAALAAWAVRALASSSARVPVSLGAAVACVAAFIWLGATTWRQCHAYEDFETIWNHTLQREPNSWLASNNLAAIHMDRGEWREARRLFERAIEADESIAETHTNLGIVVVTTTGDWRQAAPHWERAVELDPNNAAACYNLGETRLRQGRIDEAIELFRDSLQSQPNDPLTLRSLGGTLVHVGEIEEGMEHLNRSLRIRPDSPEARLSMSIAYRRTGEFARAASVLREGLNRTPRHAGLANALAWMLAACPDPNVRDGVEAVRLARLACQLTRNQSAETLDALAAALAEAGQFAEAQTAARSAVAVAQAQGRSDLAARINQRLMLYQQSRPYRVP